MLQVKGEKHIYLSETWRQAFLKLPFKMLHHCTKWTVMRMGNLNSNLKRDDDTREVKLKTDELKFSGGSQYFFFACIWKHCNPPPAGPFLTVMSCQTSEHTYAFKLSLGEEIKSLYYYSNLSDVQCVIFWALVFATHAPPRPPSTTTTTISFPFCSLKRYLNAV